MPKLINVHIKNLLHNTPEDIISEYKNNTINS